MFLAAYMFVAAREMRAVGTEVNVSFALPTGHRIRAVGTVRWIRDPRAEKDFRRSPGIGIQFQNFGREEAEAVRAYVERRAPLFFSVGR
jgi:Tfp pilus assembly protein PilZ